MKNVRDGKFEVPEYLNYKKIKFPRKKDWDSITFAMSWIKDLPYDIMYAQIKTFLNIRVQTKSLFTYWTDETRKRYLKLQGLNYVIIPPMIGVRLKELVSCKPDCREVVQMPNDIYVPVINNVIYYPYTIESCVCAIGYWTFERVEIKRKASKNDKWPFIRKDPDYVLQNEYDYGMYSEDE